MEQAILFILSAFAVVAFGAGVYLVKIEIDHRKKRNQRDV